VWPGYGEPVQHRDKLWPCNGRRALSQNTPVSAQRKRNIVFIPTESVGYGDLGAYGGGKLRASTPRIDQLADEGLRLAQYLVEPGETPSRAALMTEQETFIGSELVSARWKQWRIFFTHVHRRGIGPQRDPFSRPVFV